MQDFDISLPELGLRIGGRARQPLTFHEGEMLTADDLLRLNESRETTAPPIKKLRERHHALARMLAIGTPPGEAAIVCGYSVSRVSILQGDPAFAELVAHYREVKTERYFDGMQAMAELHLDAVEEIRERLEDAPDDFSTGHLMELMKLTADRTGKGPSTKSEVDIKIGLADKLQAGYARVQEMRAQRMKDVTPEKEN